MPPKHYRAKPITVEAVEWTGDNITEVAAFIGAGNYEHEPFEDNKLTVVTHNGTVTVNVGDYVMKDNTGGPYPCVPQVFHQRWEEANMHGVQHPEYPHAEGQR